MYHSSAKREVVDPLGGVCACSEAMCRVVKTAASMLFKSVSEYGVSGGPGGLRNTRVTQRRCNSLSWFRPIQSLRPAADDPYTQEHPKSRGLQHSVREKERFSRGSLGADPRDASLPVEPSPLPKRGKMTGAVEKLSVPLSGLLCSRCRARMEW